MSQDAWTRLAGQLAEVLARFADGAGNEDPPEPLAAAPPRPADEHALGKRQRQIVEVPDLAGEEGLKTAGIAAAVDYDVPNTYTTLQALARSQVVEQVPGSAPQRWRLARRYRAGSQVFAQLAVAVGAGEWTTAGDVSVAVRGDLTAADSIGRADPSHRVLAGAAPDEAARARLAAEGVTFDDAGRPDPARRVSWDELARRAAATTERRHTMSTASLNYLQIPAVDVEESATFYQQVFGWRLSRYPAVGVSPQQTGYVGFTYSAGRAGGEFVLDRAPSREPGLLPCIAVDSIDEVLPAVLAAGGEVVQPRTPIVAGTDWEARFRDPAGNVLGLYEKAEG